MTRVSTGLLMVLLGAEHVLASGSEGGGVNPFAGDIGNAIWTVVIFLLVVVVLGKFAWGPILDGLQKREAFIRESLEQAKKDREAAEARLKEYDTKLSSARAEASAIVEEGRRDADALKRKLEDTAKAEAAAMLERARREISIATESALKEIYALSANLATDIAGRLIHKEVDQKQHERLIEQSIDELRKSYKSRAAMEGAGSKN